MAFGTSGNVGMRVLPVCRIGRIVAALTCGITSAALPIMKSTWPAMASFMAGPPPRYGALIAMKLDNDVLGWLKSQGKGYQTRINTILRRYYETHRKAG
jgi:hypothetical protein